MSSFIERYKACKENIYQISINTQHKVGIGILSVLLSLLILLGPVVLLANCFIFNDYYTLIIIGILFCIYFVIFLSRVFYYKTLTKKQVKDMHIFYLVDSFICLIGLIIGIIVGLYI